MIYDDINPIRKAKDMMVIAFVNKVLAIIGFMDFIDNNVETKYDIHNIWKRLDEFMRRIQLMLQLL